MSEVTRSEILAKINDMDLRRIEAFGNASRAGRDSRKAKADATTVSDLETLRAARELLDDYSISVLDIWLEVEKDWGKYRCAVCGMTRSQSEAIGYDCTLEC